MPLEASLLVCRVSFFVFILLWEVERKQGDKKGGALAGILGVLTAILMGFIANNLASMWLMIEALLAGGMAGAMLFAIITPVVFSRKPPQRGIFEKDESETEA